jgi:hypothetical protein
MARSRLPKALWSTQGAIPVTVVKGLMKDKRAFGLFNLVERYVHIDKGCGDDTQLATLCHELVEVALWDSGLHNVIKPKLKEAVCDALGTYLASAANAGYIKLTVPKAPK